ncbi:GntR family transcriptional regulator [Burkholderia cenocepacia]|uniref:GntR family transcriptional regulator n=1 Tax=Burkholderia cenocepacia TaxID=95486 RepID=UPI00209BAAA7|nr:winged helix-turn-helix domain-containing protein [Burkholderia cenocepacia]
MKQRAKASLSGAMADNLAKQIEEGVLPAGAKLPSIREYAEASGCSKNTVISAFEMLAADGLIGAAPRLRLLRHATRGGHARPRRAELRSTARWTSCG